MFKQMMCAALAAALLTATAFAESAPATVCPVAPAFSDVTPDKWYAPAVEELRVQGVVSGMGDGTFHPDEAVSRAQFLQMIAEISGEETESFQIYYPALEPYRDVPDDAWYLDALTWGCARGIVCGYDDGTFRPGTGVTRQEAAVFLKRYFDERYSAVPETVAATQFSDRNEIAAWAAAAVESCQKAGVITGYPDGTFHPATQISRAEAAMIINQARFAGVVNDTAPKTESLAAALLLGAEAKQTTEKNYLISPYSAKIALALAANGATGQTRSEILQAAGIEDLNQFNQTCRTTARRYDEASAVMTIQAANSIWVNTGKTAGNFSEDYRNTLTDFYQAQAGQVNDSNAVATINKWVSEHTAGKINNAVSDNNFWAMLVNTLYFKAAWEMPFSVKDTTPGVFTRADGMKSDVQMMHQTEQISYYETPGIQMIELPYCSRSGNGLEWSGGAKAYDDMDVGMYLILSDAPLKDVDTLISNAKMRYEQVAVTLPKFAFSTQGTLDDTLKALGMKTAYQTQADFSDMFSAPMWISTVRQNAFISVDEAGTEAAAVTTVAYTGGAMLPPQIREFTADRPFTFAIRDNTTGEILFLGEYHCAA